MSALPSRSPLGLIASALLLLLGLAYPFAVYFGLQHLSPRLFAAGLGARTSLSCLDGARRDATRRIYHVEPGFRLVFFNKKDSSRFHFEARGVVLDAQPRRRCWWHFLVQE